MKLLGISATLALVAAQWHPAFNANDYQKLPRKSFAVKIRKAAKFMRQDGEVSHRISQAMKNNKFSIYNRFLDTLSSATPRDLLSQNMTMIHKKLRSYVDEQQQMRTENSEYRGSMCGPGETHCDTFLPLDAIWEYGCWCYFSEDAGSGSGPIMDELDGVCQELQKCYRCSRLDSLQDSEICHPGTQEYIAGKKNTLFINEEAILLDCSTHNPGNNCAIHTCTCETQFLANLLKLFFSGHLFDFNQYDRAVWSEHKAVCKNHKYNKPAVMECCGYYPNRQPYNIESGNQSCCNGESLFFPGQSKCCDGQVVPKAGSDTC